MLLFKRDQQVTSALGGLGGLGGLGAALMELDSSFRHQLLTIEDDTKTIDSIN